MDPQVAAAAQEGSPADASPADSTRVARAWVCFYAGSYQKAPQELQRRRGGDKEGEASGYRREGSNPLAGGSLVGKKLEKLACPEGAGRGAQEYGL